MLIIGKFRVDADQRRLTDIGADIGNSLHIRHQILEIGVCENITLAPAHSVKMVSLELADHVCGHLLQRLDPERRVHVPLSEREVHIVKDLP